MIITKTEVYLVINRDLKGRYKSKKIKSNLLNLKNRIKSLKSNYESIDEFDFENYKTKMNEFLTKITKNAYIRWHWWNNL